MSASIKYDTEGSIGPEDRVAKQLPDVTGYRLLIMLPKTSEKTDAGIYIPEERMNAESVASIVGFVLKVGPDAYADKDRFPNGPWCKEGDWVLMQSYTGTRFKLHGEEFRIINDDSVEAVVEDPRGYSRA